MYVSNFLNLISHQITGGSEYLWKCFGDNARFLDSDELNTECIFDSKTQVVYQVIFSLENMVYRWTDDRYIQAFKSEEAEKLSKDDESELEYVDVLSLDELVAMIKNEKKFKESFVDINLDDDVLYDLMKLAHERDITLNQLINEILRKFVDENKDKMPEPL